MIRRSIDNVEESDLVSLIRNQVTEGRSLEFKRELPGGSDSDLKEFLADVTSLANAQGGDLIFGIADKNGSAESLVGLDVTDPDAAILRLENILRDGIEPRLTGVRIQWVPLQSGEGAIVLRAPASLAAPHRIRFKNSGRFFSRNSRGKYEMDTYELRQAFTASEEFPDRLRALHQRALQNSKGLDFPTELSGDPAVVASVMPLSFLRDRRDLAVSEDNAVVPTRIGGGLSYVHTLEGVLFHTVRNSDRFVRSYTLTHRRGRVDAGWTIGGNRELRPGKSQKLVFGNYFRQGLLDVGRASVTRLTSLGIEGPWVAFATLLRVHGSRLGINNYDLSDAAWQDEITLPEVIADELSEETLRPILNAFPLVFGVPSNDYRYPA